MAETALQSEVLYLDAGKLGLNEFWSLPKCLQPAPLSPECEKKMLALTKRKSEFADTV